MAERKSMLLSPMTSQQITENVFKHYNYDGVAAHQDLQKIASADAARKQLRMTMPMWFGMTVFSGYNVTRMGVLSNSGRIGAMAGLAVGAIMTVSTATM